MVTAIRMQKSPDRVILWAVIVSVLIHGVAFIPWISKLADAVAIDFSHESQSPPLEFTLVSPPPDPSEPEQPSEFLSTQSARMQQQRASDGSANTPLSGGTLPLPDNPSPQTDGEGGGESDVPPLPKEVSSLNDAIARSRFVDRPSPQQDLSIPDDTPEFRSDGSARASVGNIQLNTTAWDFAPYLLDLKHRIKNHWIPPLAFTALGAIHGYTVVRFRIYPDGTMQAMKILDTEGHGSLHRSSTNAIQGAAPFRRLPTDFPEDYLEITFGFYYLLPGDEERFFKKQQQERGRE